MTQQTEQFELNFRNGIQRVYLWSHEHDIVREYFILLNLIFKSAWLR